MRLVAIRCEPLGPVSIANILAGDKHAPDLVPLIDRLAGRLGARRLFRMSAVESRSEEHTSELQSLMRISYAVFCLTKKMKTTNLLCWLSTYIPIWCTRMGFIQLHNDIDTPHRTLLNYVLSLVQHGLIALRGDIDFDTSISTQQIDSLYSSQ